VRFDMVFNLSTPFLYNPNAGFLLMDINITGFDGISGALDAEAFNPNGTGGPVAQVDSQDQVDLGGLIVRFGYTTVPEPSALPLFGFGLIAGWTMRRRK
jgi:hypothetical protein